MMADDPDALTGSDVSTSALSRLEDADDVDQFRFVVNVVLMGALSAIGLVCNTLSIVTLHTDRHKMSMTVLLQGLAVSDNLFLLYTLLYSTLRTAVLRAGATESERHLSAAIVAYVLPFGWIAQTASIWIMCSVTADRYVAICHPFASQRLCSVGRSRRALAAIWLAAVLFNLPRFFYYHQMAFGGRDGAKPGIFVAHSDAAHDFWDRYHAAYHIGLTIVCLYLIPLPIIVVLNALLVREIARARTRRRLQQGMRKGKDNVRITLNLVIVVTVFVVCETPDLVASVLRISWINVYMNPVAMCYYLSVKELLLVMSSATNFLIYCVFYAKFRKLLNEMLCSRNRSFFCDSDTKSSVKNSRTIECLDLRTAEESSQKTKH